MKILELIAEVNSFPTWMLVPATLKLETHSIPSNPPQVMELSAIIGGPGSSDARHLPGGSVARDFANLQVFRARSGGAGGDSVVLLDVLRSRKVAVERGLEANGIKVKSLENLVFVFECFEKKALTEIRLLVGTVVDSNSESA